MRTLERITVTGYKSIRELRGEDGQGFKFSDINVLIGANGSRNWKLSAKLPPEL